MNKKNALLAVFTFIHLVMVAQNMTISGYVVDKNSKEPLIGANVYNPQTYQGAVTNKFGYFVLSVPVSTDSIMVSYIGYKRLVIAFNRDKPRYILALIAGKEIGEIDICAKKSNSYQVIQPLSISTKQVKLLPTITGEADLMKAYQYLPGIGGGAEGNNSLYVRGGSPDQNLILLDDVPLYYVNHIGGIVSIFDENAMSNVDVYKSGFPARYGGRLSSVIDVRMKNGNMNKFGGEFSIGLISSKIHLNGPIIKDKVSFMLTARKSMTDFYMRPITHYTMDNDSYVQYAFYDINAKLNWKINNKNRIYLSGYSGEDGTEMRASFDTDDNNDRLLVNESINEYRFMADIGNSWGNRLACFRWNHLFSQKLFSNLTIAATNYFYTNSAHNKIVLAQTDQFTEKYGYQFSSGLNDLTGKIDLDYFINNHTHLRFGCGYTHHEFDTGQLQTLYDINEEALADSSLLLGSLQFQVDTTYGNDQILTNEVNSYIEADFELSNKFHINTGIYSSFYLLSDQNYFSLQPRLALRYKASPHLSATASYARMVQNIHMLSGSDTSTPSDIWLPATSYAKPEMSDQVSLGGKYTTNNQLYEFNIEAFYKTMNNLIDYKLGYNLTNATESWYNVIETDGKGWCYGLELHAEKTKGDFTGWIAYTLSKNMRQFRNINANNPYEYVYDRPHDISIVANYKLSEKITLTGTWEYCSGRRITLGTAAYDNNAVVNHFDLMGGGLVYNLSDKYRNQLIDFGNETATIYGVKNNYQLPDYHKLNVSAHFTKKKKQGVRTWTIGVQNVYNRMNAYNIYYSESKDETFQMNRITLFPIMPNFSYNFKF